MGNIIAALLVGGFATIALVLPYGVYVAILVAPFGASLLAVIVAVGSMILRHPSLSPRRSKKELPEFDRQRN
jgi:Flp pilus assembly protein TadB